MKKSSLWILLYYVISHWHNKVCAFRAILSNNRLVHCIISKRGRGSFAKLEVTKKDQAQSIGGEEKNIRYDSYQNIKKKKNTTKSRKEDINNNNNILYHKVASSIDNKGVERRRDILLQRIRDCETIEELLDLQGRNHVKMKHYHISMCWNQASCLMIHDGVERKKIRGNPRIFNPLVKLTMKRNGEFESRSLANTAHGIAKILSGISSHRRKNFLLIDSKIWELIEEKSLELLSTFEPRDYSILLWSFAKVNRKATSLFKSVESRIILQLNKFNSQGISNTVWAYATSNHDAPKLFDAIAIKIIHRLETFEPQHLSNTLWAYATANHPAPTLYDSIAKLINDKNIQILNKFNSQNLSNMLWAYAKQIDHRTPDIKASAELFDSIARISLKKGLHSFKPQEISNMLWAYATIISKEGYQTTDIIARFFSDSAFSIVTDGGKRLDKFKPQEISNMLWAYATLDIKTAAALDLFPEVATKLVLDTEKLHKFNSQEISNTLWAYTKVHQYCPALFDTIEKVAIQKSQKFNAQEISNTLWAYGKVGHFAPKLLDAFAIETIKRNTYNDYKNDDFNSQAISNILGAYARLGRAAPELFESLERNILKKLHSFKPEEISKTLWAYAKSGYAPLELFHFAEQMAMENLDSFSSRDIGNMVWAYSRVNHRAPGLFAAVAQRVREDDNMNKMQHEVDGTAFDTDEIINMFWSSAKTAGGQEEDSELFDIVARITMEKFDTPNGGDV